MARLRRKSCLPVFQGERRISLAYFFVRRGRQAKLPAGECGVKDQVSQAGAFCKFTLFLKIKGYDNISLQ
jgi:hypothetical protein